MPESGVRDPSDKFTYKDAARWSLQLPGNERKTAVITSSGSCKFIRGMDPAPGRCPKPSGANAARSATSVFVAVLTKSLRLTAEDCLMSVGRSSADQQKTRRRALNENCVAQGGIAPRQRKPKAGGTTNTCNKLVVHQSKCQKMNREPQHSHPLQDVNLSEGCIPPQAKGASRALQPPGNERKAATHIASASCKFIRGMGPGGVKPKCVIFVLFNLS
jgi:hypothetical protein